VTGSSPAGFPHSDISGSKPACGSPKLFAACHVLPRRSVPRHPHVCTYPLDLLNLTRRSLPYTHLKARTPVLRRSTFGALHSLFTHPPISTHISQWNPSKSPRQNGNPSLNPKNQGGSVKKPATRMLRGRASNDRVLSALGQGANRTFCSEAALL